MANRLSKIYTRTGDDGTTGMADGSRVSKADARFDAMGSIDLLNSHIGLLRAQLGAKTADASKPATIDSNIAINLDTLLSQVQHLLFNIGGELAMPGYQGIRDTHVSHLEQQIDAWNQDLPYLKDFILPAGSLATAQTHVARCHCRDAERVLIKLNQQAATVSAVTLQFINRLSDWLFVLARVMSRLDGGQEVLWDKQVLATIDPPASLINE